MKTVSEHFLKLFKYKVKTETENNKVLYFHKTPDDKVFYVGIGNLKRPYSKRYRNKWWHNTVNKYGYKVEIFIENLSHEEAIKEECYYIKHFGRADLNLGTLVNMTDGGDGANNPSEETRSKISESSLGRKHSDESKQKISQNHAKHNLGKKASQELKDKLSKSHIGIQAGEKHPLYGKHHSQEARDKIGAAHKGMKHSEKTLKQMRDVKLGKIKTDEHRKNLSLSLSGKPKSETAKKNMSIAKKGKELTEAQKLSNKRNGENRIGTQLSIKSRSSIGDAMKRRNIEFGLKVSNYKGVVWDKKREKWKVSVYRNKKANYLGHFENELDASKKYNEFINTNLN